MRSASNRPASVLHFFEYVPQSRAGATAAQQITLYEDMKITVASSRSVLDVAARDCTEVNSAAIY